MAGGRPTKYDPAMCEVVEEMMAEGCSKVEVCAALDICFETFQNFQLKHKEFSESVNRGERLSQAWWEKKGRVNIENREFNTPLWKSNMANRFRWTDKSEQALTGADGGPIEVKGIDVAFIKPGKS